MSSASPTPGEPVDLKALLALAEREHGAGRLVASAAAYHQILAIRPDVAEIHNDLGIVLARAGKLKPALDEFERAIALKPNLADAYNNLGIIFRQQGRLDEAASRFQQALALRPDYADAHNNLGNIFERQEKLDQAVAHLERALALRPDWGEALSNLGNVLVKQNQLDKALVQFERAIALLPGFADAYNNMATALQYQGHLDQAVACYERALALKPDYPSAESGVANCLLAKEDYRRGWPRWEARLRRHGSWRQPDLPSWKGEPLAGRRLLLVATAGLGDTLHFLRFARQFKARGAHVVLGAQAALVALLKGHPDLDELFLLGSAEEPPPCDYYLPLLSAPGALKTDSSSIPAEIPYLWADPELIEGWRQELAQIEGFKIGIAWQGSREYALDRWRSMPLACFAPLARIPGVQLISLQKSFGTEQIATVDFPVVDLSDRLDEAAGPFMDTAAVIRNLDLVVTVDTAVGHLAGALGAPVFLAVTFSPDWRWLRDRDDSPWYPTIRLFRQTKFGQWSDVFERIAQAVGERMASQDKTR